MINEAKDRKWQVYFGKNFWAKSGNEHSEQEIRAEKRMNWDGVPVYIPSVYVCQSGIVVDICMEVDSECVKRYIEKWNLYKKSSVEMYDEDQILNENPLNWDVNINITINGEALKHDGSCGVSWIPMLQEGWENDKAADAIVNHYQLNPAMAWGIHRYSFAWMEQKPLQINCVEITLEQKPIWVLGTTFRVNAAGDQICMEHPITGENLILKVIKYEDNELEQSHLKNMNKENMEYPSYFKVMSYSITPELDGKDFFINDCSRGDSPRVINNGKISKSASAIAVISGADGPVSVFVGTVRKVSKIHTVCSALHFQPVKEVEWKIGFYKKEREDISVKLL